MDNQQESSLTVVPSRQEAYPNLNAGNPGNNGGRPTKYEEKYCEELINFFNVEKNFRYIKSEKITTKSNGTQEVWRDYAYMANDLPTLDKFARLIQVDRHRLSIWANAKYPIDYEEVDKRGKLKRPKFNAAYNRAKELQKEFLIDNGLKGLYPPAAFIFVAKNVTDMRDKQDIDHTTNGKDLPTPILGSLKNVPKNNSNK